MGEDRVRDALRAHSVLGIDTMAFIYHLDFNPEYTHFTDILFDLIETGECRGVTSILTLMETLVKPMEIGDIDIKNKLYYALTMFPNLTMRNVDSEVAETAAEFRAKFHLRPPDAIQIATCMVEGGNAFVTNDERLRKIDDPAIIIMKDYI